MQRATKSDPRSRIFATSGLAFILIGIALTMTLGQQFSGFLGGMFQGAGIALILLGVVSVAASWRRPGKDSDGESRGWWLPSRDRQS